MRTTGKEAISSVQSNDEILERCLRLQSVPQIGIISLQKTAKLLDCELLNLTQMSQKQLLEVGWTQSQANSLLLGSKEISEQFKLSREWLNKRPNHHFIALSDKAYPPTLKQISRPPLFLFVHGNVDLLNHPQLAFVGSRAASPSAIAVTHQLIQQLSQRTIAHTISGLAMGIDAACHQASLANEVATVGVLGCGIDVIYPKRNKKLYAEVANAGALVSEFVPGTQPVATMFPRRNRIISGLSLGTVVVEAKIKSGSLVTAKYALEQNREVFAVPNHINNVNAQGCHFLIKQGAKLTESIDDILDELPSIAKNDEKIEKKPLENLASDPLLDSVDYSATSVDLIAKRTGESLSDLLPKLLQYEMRGLVASTAEGYVKLRG